MFDSSWEVCRSGVTSATFSCNSEYYRAESALQCAHLTRPGVDVARAGSAGVARAGSAGVLLAVVIDTAAVVLPGQSRITADHGPVFGRTPGGVEAPLSVLTASGPTHRPTHRHRSAEAPTGAVADAPKHRPAHRHRSTDRCTACLCLSRRSRLRHGAYAERAAELARGRAGARTCGGLGCSSWSTGHVPIHWSPDMRRAWGRTTVHAPRPRARSSRGSEVSSTPRARAEAARRGLEEHTKLRRGRGRGPARRALTAEGTPEGQQRALRRP